MRHHGIVSNLIHMLVTIVNTRIILVAMIGCIPNLSNTELLKAKVLLCHNWNNMAHCDLYYSLYVHISFFFRKWTLSVWFWCLLSILHSELFKAKALLVAIIRCMRLYLLLKQIIVVYFVLMSVIHSTFRLQWKSCVSEKYLSQSVVTSLMEGKILFMLAEIYPMPFLCSSTISYWLCHLSGNCSYEDWGVDELIVEDSWKRQVGGDWNNLFLCKDLESKHLSIFCLIV